MKRLLVVIFCIISCYSLSAMEKEPENKTEQEQETRTIEETVSSAWNQLLNVQGRRWCRSWTTETRNGKSFLVIISRHGNKNCHCSISCDGNPVASAQGLSSEQATRDFINNAIGEQ